MMTNQSRNQPKPTPAKRKAASQSPQHQPSVRAGAHARTRGPDKLEVLEETLNEVIAIALANGVTREQADDVLFRMADKLATSYRAGLKLRTKNT